MGKFKLPKNGYSKFARYNITHYPLIYIYTAWVCNNNATITEGIPYMILVLVGAIALAYASLKLYDEPVRRRLTECFLKKTK